MNGGPSGFYNAPVTRTYVIASALLTILFGVQGRSSRLGLSYQVVMLSFDRAYNPDPTQLHKLWLGLTRRWVEFEKGLDAYKSAGWDIFTKLHFWRLIASGFAFSSTPELIFGVYLLYYFRVFERQIGSNKYSIFILFSTIASTLFEVLFLALFRDQTIRLLASGPYGLIFSSFVPFYFDIPVSSRFRIFGIHFTDKSFIYLAGLQLLLSSWKRSLLPGLCGVLAGFIYRVNAFRIRRIKFPEIVASFFSRLPWLSSEGPSQNLPSGNIMRNVPSYVGRQVEANYPAPTSLAPVPLPPENSIATLVSMGFDTNSARQALVRAQNDINVATNILLEAQSR